MAPEIQPAQSMPPELPIPSHFTSTRSDSHFLSLPDNVFHKLFQYLSGYSGKAGAGSANAFNLAATCRELYNCYRSSVVAVHLRIGRNSPSDVLFRALERLPRLKSIDLEQLSPSEDSLESDGSFEDRFKIWSEMREAYLRVLRTTASMQKSRSSQGRALDIKELYMTSMSPDWDHMKPEPAISVECVRSAMETFSSLEALYVHVHACQGGYDAITAIVETLSNSLRTLRLRYFTGFTNLSNMGNPRIGELHCLRKLDLRLCDDEITFDALGMLEGLVELSLSNCAISDAAACRLVGRLPKLTTLKVWSCENVTSAIFGCLPVSLVELAISNMVAEDFGRAPCIELEGAPNLTSLSASGPGVPDASFLRPFAPRLRFLGLPGTNVSDEDMAHWIRQMPNLERLNLSDTSVSDETARAVSSLGKITVADLDLTQVGIDGVKALLGGVACQSLQWLVLNEWLGSVEGGAVKELERMVSENRKRSGVHPSGPFIYNY